MYAATAGLVVEDARSSTISNSRSADAERYVADQVAILGSVVVAERASALAAEFDPPADISLRDFGQGLAIASTSESNFIEITFRGDDAEAARAGANAIGLSYQETIGAALAEDAQTAITRLDEAIDETVQEIVSLQTQVETVRVDNSDRLALDDQLSEIVSELVELRSAAQNISVRADQTVTDQIQEVTARANQLTAELNARLLVSDVEAQLPATAVLLSRQRDAAALLTELTLQRSQVEVNAELAGNGVAFFAPAGSGRSEGISASSAVLVSGVLGGMVGVGLAFWLGNRRQRVEDRLAPRQILGVPLLVDVPGRPTRLPVPALSSSFGRDRIGASSVVTPVLDEPTSGRAEAFRILAGALQRDLREWRADPYGSKVDAADQRGMVIACVSADSREATTLVSVNAALAAGKVGLRVLLLDGDVISRDVSRLLDRIQHGRLEAGLTDVVRGSVALEEAIGRVELGDGNHISTLKVGTAAHATPDLLGSPSVSAVVQKLSARHELVVVAVPPVLEAAHASAIQQADRVLVAVEHGSSVDHLRELRHRVEILGVPMGGYAYLSAPKRPRRTGRRVSSGAPRQSELRDDLTLIRGIGPGIQEVLYENEITTYEKLAATSPGRIREILEEAGPAYAIHDPSTWPYQASIGGFESFE